MFGVTFLGHQGWQFAGGGATILLDPLLCDGFGHDPRGNGFDVFPPRRIDFARCPPIDAILFSHEHEDHFNVPTLERLDRRIPIHLSARSSSAARTILGELGFTVRLIQPGEPFAVRNLAVLPFAQASLGGSHPGEWDSLALYVADRGGDGSFFTTVDHRPQVRSFAMLRQHRLRPALVAYADNEQDHSAMFPWAQAGDGVASLVDEMRYLLDRVVPRDQRLEGVLLCANGYATRGDLAWMNRSIFHRDARRVCDALRPQHGDLFLAPVPGDTVTLRQGRRSEGLARSTWIAALEEDRWPARDSGAAPPASFGPASGRRRLEDPERPALARALGAFAEFLYASPLFLEMYLLDAASTAGRRPTMAFVLLEDREGRAAPTVWAWDPNACAFVREPCERPEDVFVAGARCWASDLRAVLEAEMPAASLTVGRLSGWNAAPSRLRFDLPNLLHVYCHPLRAPDRFLALYRGLLRGQPPVVRPAAADA